MIEWWKAERASTSPSTSVTVTHAGAPVTSAFSMRLAAEPWTTRRSPMRANAVGITNGWPPSTNPTWQMKAASRIAWIVAAS